MQGSNPIPSWAMSNKLFEMTYKTFRMLRDEGLDKTLFAIKYVIRRYKIYSKLRKGFYLTDEERQQQSSRVFDYSPKISIIIPLYNTPMRFLKELFNSIAKQSYGNYEVCLADGSDGAHTDVGEYVRGLAASDSRIIYKKLDENKGIAENTNAAILLSSGNYIALVDHDDLLSHRALYTVVERINETGADFLYSDEAIFNNTPSDSNSIHFKPCFSPDFLRCCNYICHLSVIKRTLLDKVGLYRHEYDGSQDYDFTLRVTEQAERIEHIDIPLYFWRVHAGSVASGIGAKPYALDAAKRSVEAHLERVGLKGRVEFSRAVPMLHVEYEIENNPLISIIIPTCDHADVLKRCIDSIKEKTTYGNYEILVVENNSRQKETFDYYETLKSDEKISIVFWDGAFNFSAINNYAVKFAHGEQLLFLNNDIEVITPNWLEEMVMFTQRSDVAACGVKLLYPNDTVQHGGIAVGVGGSAANLCPLFPRDNDGYLDRLAIVSDMSACTAACLMVRRDTFEEVGGFDETLAVSFNDVDLCLKLREKGYYIVFNPVCECYHHESLSRGYDNKGEKKERMEREKAILVEKWKKYYPPDGCDPFYSRNFGENAVSYDA